jgi:hypothetical protein
MSKSTISEAEVSQLWDQNAALWTEGTFKNPGGGGKGKQIVESPIDPVQAQMDRHAVVHVYAQTHPGLWNRTRESQRKDAKTQKGCAG